MGLRSVSVKDETPALRDGVIRVNVHGMGGETKGQIAIDCLLLKLCCEEAETAHGMTVAGDKPPTAAFLSDLAKRLQSLGVEGCSASIAYQLWHLAGEMMHQLKKNTNETPTSRSGSTSRPTAKGRKAKSRKGKR
jgi:hypothetical protein